MQGFSMDKAVKQYMAGGGGDWGGICGLEGKCFAQMLVNVMGAAALQGAVHATAGKGCF